MRRFLSPDPWLASLPRGNWAWLRAIGATILVFFVYFVLTLLAFISLDAVRFLLGGGVTPGSLAANEVLLAEGNPYSFAVFALNFIAMLAAALIMLRFNTGKWSFGVSLYAPFRWADFWKAAIAFTLVATLAVGIYYLYDPAPFKVREVSSSYPAWFLLALLILAVQSLAEEVLFKGYLFRVWGAVLPYRVFTVTIIMALFLGPHLGNPDIAADLIFMAIVFITFELVSWWLVFRSGSLAASWGKHWSNNVVAVLLFASEPGFSPDMALTTFIDPVYAEGGSYLYNPRAYLAYFAVVAVFVVLMRWPASPFYIAARHPKTPDKVASS